MTRCLTNDVVPTAGICAVTLEHEQIEKMFADAIHLNDSGCRLMTTEFPVAQYAPYDGAAITQANFSKVYEDSSNNVIEMRSSDITLVNRDTGMRFMFEGIESQSSDAEAVYTNEWPLSILINSSNSDLAPDFI